MSKEEQLVELLTEKNNRLERALERRELALRSALTEVQRLRKRLGLETDEQAEL